MRRALALMLLLILALTVRQLAAQPSQGFGPVYDAANQALRVNTVAGAAAGGTSSNFGTAFPGTGTAAGAKDQNGAMASLTLSSTGRLQVTCDNCSSSAGTFGTAFPSSGGPVGFKDGNNAFASVSTTNGLPVTFAGVANVRTTSDSTLTATVTQSNGANLNVRTSSDSTLTATVTSSNGANLNVRTSSDSTLTATVTSANGANLNVRLSSDSTSTATVTQSNGANLNVRTSSDSTLTATVTSANANNLNATVTQGPAGTPWNVRVTSDSTITATVTQTTAANLQVRPDYSAATSTSTTSRVANIGGWGSSGNAQPFLRCDNVASISTANTGNYILVASVSGQTIYVCGYTFVAGPAPVGVKFVAGNGGTPGLFNNSCDHDSADLTGAMTVAASGGVVNSTGMAPAVIGQAGKALCINLSNGSAVGGHLSWARF